MAFDLHNYSSCIKPFNRIVKIVGYIMITDEKATCGNCDRTTEIAVDCDKFKCSSKHCPYIKGGDDG